MMRLSQILIPLSAQLLGTDVEFTSVSTDSRNLSKGALFIALHGERFDGHDYVAQAQENGAAAALVTKALDIDIPQVIVGDTRLALGNLAAYWRQQFSIPVAAITGSNGKTTVKEMLAAILRFAAGNEEDVLATKGNLNNDIGLPLTLLGLRPHHRYAVTEMGMNHTGEIQYITRIAKPTVALINNAGNAHLEGLGSIEAVASAKGEIFEGLSAHGIAVINHDDAFAELWKSLAGKRKVITFGFDQSADVSADYRLLPESSQIAMKTAKGELSFELTIPGEHNVKNALAAASVAIALGISLPAISAGFGQFSGVKGRLQKQSCKFGAKLIDDTYNANPASMRAAVDVLSGLSGTRILVMGDMGELGDRASELHREIGQYAKSKGIDVLFALGDLSLETVKAFGAGATHFESIEALVAALMTRLDQQVTVLVKGSRFMRMERVVHALLPSSVTEAA